MSLPQMYIPAKIQNQSSFLGLKPTLPWILILGFSALTAIGIFVGIGRVLNFAFPLGSFVIATILYFRYPILYNGFTWWIWILSPLVRRFADYRGGFIDPSPILLAPFLVTLVSLVTLFHRLPAAKKQGEGLFIMAVIGVAYGILIGGIQVSFINALVKGLEWLAPVSFGFHLLSNWRNYPSYRQNIQRTFLWGVVVTGTYGVFQFLTAPDWDRTWLINVSDKATSFGTPEPFGIRVWSTLNGPGVFAQFMVAGLLLLLSNPSPVSLSATAVGYLSFLLSLVRAAWFGWFVGVLGLLASLKPKFQIRLTLFLIVAALCVIPLTTIEPFSDVIVSRVQSLADGQNDGSAAARQEGYGQMLGYALTNLLGDGIGGQYSTYIFDSGILDLWITLGWFGAVFYLSGLLLSISQLMFSTTSNSDSFANGCRAIVLGTFAQIAFGSVIRGFPGMLLWSFLGIGLAAQKYQQKQSLKTVLPPASTSQSN